MAGRTLEIYEHVYMDGYDMTGYARSSGEQGVEYPEHDLTTFADSQQGMLVGKPTLTFGPFNGVFDNTATSGLHVLAAAAQGTRRNIMVAYGIRTTPAIGDEAFCAPMLQSSYKSVLSGGTLVNMTFGADVNSAMLYDEFFGKMLHILGAETGANTANTNADFGAASVTKGGWLMYQINAITGGAGTAAVSVDHSTTGTSGWAALAGATYGALAYSAAPTSGIVKLATNVDVNRYLRWQLALAGGATGATFALAFMRGRVQ